MATYLPVEKGHLSSRNWTHNLRLVSPMLYQRSYSGGLPLRLIHTSFPAIRTDRQTDNKTPMQPLFPAKQKYNKHLLSSLLKANFDGIFNVCLNSTIRTDSSHIFHISDIAVSLVINPCKICLDLKVYKNDQTL